MGLTSPNKHIKMHLNVEKFSLKTNWKLAERLLHSQGCRKDTNIPYEEKKSNPLEPCDPAQELREEARIQLDPCPRECAVRATDYTP